MIPADPGQRTNSAIVEVVFLLVLGVLGYAGKLSEAILGMLLSSYATGRLGLGAGKLIGQQQARDRGDGPPSGGSGSEPRMPAVREPPPRRYGPPIPREDRRGAVAFVVALFRVDPRAAFAFFALAELAIVLAR